jgi:hypothetical protein
MYVLLIYTSILAIMYRLSLTGVILYTCTCISGYTNCHERKLINVFLSFRQIDSATLFWLSVESKCKYKFIKEAKQTALDP